MIRRLLYIEIDPDKRVYGLDIVRALAILSVIFVHGDFWMEDRTPAISKIFDYDGVNLFFVLSGFLIGGMLLRQIDRDDGLTLRSMFGFWKRRWFRTLPNYYLILGVNLVLLYYTSGGVERFSADYLMFIQNFKLPQHFWFQESWSLSVEEWFYFLLPVMLMLSLMAFPKKHRKLAILVSIIALAAVSFAFRYNRAMALGGDVPTTHWQFYFRQITLMRFDSIMYGVLAAFVKFYHPSFWSKRRYGWFFLGLFLIVAARLSFNLYTQLPYWYFQTLFYLFC